MPLSCKRTQRHVKRIKSVIAETFVGDSIEHNFKKNLGIVADARFSVFV